MKFQSIIINTELNQHAFFLVGGSKLQIIFVRSKHSTVETTQGLPLPTSIDLDELDRD